MHAGPGLECQDVSNIAGVCGYPVFTTCDFDLKNQDKRMRCDMNSRPKRTRTGAMAEEADEDLSLSATLPLSFHTVAIRERNIPLLYLVCCDFKSLIWQSSDDFRIRDSAPLSASPCLSPFFVHSCSFLQCHFFSRLPHSESRTLIVPVVELCLCRGWKWKRSI